MCDPGSRIGRAGPAAGRDRGGDGGGGADPGQLRRSGDLAQALAAVPAGRDPMLAEEPWLLLLAGERPFLVDGFSLLQTRRLAPEIGRYLFDCLDHCRFRAVVLMGRAAGNPWYDESQFGPGFATHLAGSYDFTGIAGGHAIHPPRCGRAGPRRRRWIRMGRRSSSAGGGRRGCGRGSIAATALIARRLRCASNSAGSAARDLARGTARPSLGGGTALTWPQTATRSSSPSHPPQTAEQAPASRLQEIARSAPLSRIHLGAPPAATINSRGERDRG